MNTYKSFIPELYGINDGSFEDIALKVFRFQAASNPVYQEYISHLRIRPAEVTSLEQIPFLPVSLFKSHTIRAGEWQPETTFLSSATSGMKQSRHDVADLPFYNNHARKCFEHFFGPVSQYHFFALLPSYLEREGSSLITMLQDFISGSGSTLSGFYLYDHDKLLEGIYSAARSGRRTILWGVSFALLDLAEKMPPGLHHCMVFETGGMKGRRREVTREELHQTLTAAFGVEAVYSEYGMTELFSQAYTTGKNRFFCPPSMRVTGRDIYDPLRTGLVNQAAAINVIDLGNLHSISFIATDDIGRVYEDGSFEINGRLDNSDIRGCNLLA